MKSEVARYVPGKYDACFVCRAKDRFKREDLVGLKFGSVSLVICNVHALQLVEQLLDRFYPRWGDGPLFDKIDRET